MYDFQKNYQKREKHDLGESLAYKLLELNWNQEKYKVNSRKNIPIGTSQNLPALTFYNLDSTFYHTFLLFK